MAVKNDTGIMEMLRGDGPSVDKVISSEGQGS